MIYFTGLYFALGSLISWLLIALLSKASIVAASIFAFVFVAVVYIMLFVLTYRLLHRRLPPMSNYLAMFDFYLLYCYASAALLYAMWLLDFSPGKDQVFANLDGDNVVVFLKILTATTGILSTIGAFQVQPVGVVGFLGYWLLTIMSPFILVFLVGWSISYFYNRKDQNVPLSSAAFQPIHA